MSDKSKSIQEKIDQLTQEVGWFDSDEFAVESAIEKFKQAEKLAEEIENDLRSARNEITVLKQKFDESSTT